MNNIKFYKSVQEMRTPCANDFMMKQSYNKWINGLYAFGPGNDENKFYTISQEYDTSDYLQLELVGGRVGNRNISLCTVSSTYVDYTNLTMRDDGYGLWYANYVDFINNIFSNFSLFTRLSATDDPVFRTNFCKLDDFAFFFKETGQVTGGLPTPQYFSIKSIDGVYLTDSIASLNPYPAQVYNNDYYYYWINV